MEALFLAASILFQRLYTEPGVACPEGLDRLGDASRAECAVYVQGLDRLKKTLNRYDKKPPKIRVQTRASGAGLPPSKKYTYVGPIERTWRKQGSFVVRDWPGEDDDMAQVIAYDEAAGIVAVLPKDSCLDPATRARDGLWVYDGDGFVRADPDDASLPPEPPRKSIQPLKTGRAMVQFVVDSEGGVGESCVWFAAPAAFGKFASKTVNDWTFEPATFEGHPVDSVVTFRIEWTRRVWDVDRMELTFDE